MVDLELSSRCFYAVVMAWNSVGDDAPNAVGEVTRSENYNWTPVKSVQEITDGDVKQFQWLALHTSWSADNFAHVPEMHNNLIQAGYDYSRYFDVFEVTSDLCRSKEVSYVELKDALYSNTKLIQMWEEERNEIYRKQEL